MKQLLLFILLITSETLFSQVYDPFFRINSKYDERNPVLSPDGLTLYFTRTNHPQNVGGERDPGDIWYSTIEPDGTWSEPQNAIKLNNARWNSVLGFVGGSDVIYLLGHYSVDGGEVKTQGIARSVKTTMGWSQPENFKIPYFRNTSKNHGGHILPDASVAVFSLETYGSKGGEDLYVSFNKGNGQWSEPRNLGHMINTVYQEFDPYLTDDGQTLYFSSNAKGVNTEIYRAERLDDSWTNWSVPEGLPELNTQGKELGYKAYGTEVVFTSTLNSDGYSDLRSFSYPDDSPAVTDSLVIAEEVIMPVSETPVAGYFKLFGTLSYGRAQKPEKVVVSLRTPEGQMVAQVDVAATEYAMIMDQNPGNYLIRVDAPGFVTSQQNLIITDDDNMLERNFSLQPIAVGTTVNLQDVLFKQSKAEFLETSYPQLNLVVDFLRDNPKIKIRLEGHTDNRGVAKYNVRLSEDRVEAVKDYLVRKGISKKRISGKGYGGARPIADNENPETRILNRRVEFTIVKD